MSSYGLIRTLFHTGSRLSDICFHLFFLLPLSVLSVPAEDGVLLNAVDRTNEVMRLLWLVSCKGVLDERESKDKTLCGQLADSFGRASVSTDRSRVSGVSEVNWAVRAQRLRRVDHQPLASRLKTDQKTVPYDHPSSSVKSVKSSRQSLSFHVQIQVCSPPAVDFVWIVSGRVKCALEGTGCFAASVHEALSIGDRVTDRHPVPGQNRCVAFHL